MHIAVLIKQVPDTDEVKMDPNLGTMIREGVEGTVNPLDLHALEAALALKKEGDSISVVSMGPPKAAEALREGVALGADRALLASDRAFAGGDSWATAKVLAAVFLKTGVPDVILAGEKATDGETGQVGPELAAMLGVSLATHATKISRCGDALHATSTLEEGLLTQELSVPCLITVLSDLNDPSMPTLSGKKRARSLLLETLTAGDLGLKEGETGLMGSPTKVVKIAHPKIARRAKKYSAKSGNELEDGLNAIIRLLEESALV